MERDFLGLSSTCSSVKEETDDGCRDSAPVRSSGMQWSFSNVGSSHPQLLSFNATREDWPKKTNNNFHVSSGFPNISRTNSFESHQNPNSVAVQNSLSLERKQAGSHHSRTTHPYFDAHSANKSQEVKMYPVPAQSSQTTSILVNASTIRSHVSSPCQGIAGSTIQLPPGGFPVLTANPINPSTISSLNTNDQRIASNSTGAIAQMTIFYAGSVTVYNDVPAEKAQAIMLLAGNGASVPTPGTSSSTSQVQASTPKPPISEIFTRNQLHASSSSLALPSSTTVHAVPHSSQRSASNNELGPGRLLGTVASTINQPEHSKGIDSLSTIAPAPVPSGVPQARKASLARFLKKRNDRVTATMPYTVGKKSPECSSPGSSAAAASFSTNFVGYSPLPATN